MSEKSEKRPTEPGFYFWKACKAAEWEPVRVHRARAGHLVIHWQQREGFVFIEHEDGIWGPRIPTPDDGQAKPTANDRITAAAPALFNAVCHVLRRIHGDPNVQYYCGAFTEALRLLSDAYAQATGENSEEIARTAATADCGEADVLRLKRRIEELESRE
jgi:hypothetical protein